MVGRKIFDRQKEYFATGLTRQIPFRLAKLQKLKKAIEAREKDLYESLALDLGKSVMEAYSSEVGFSLGEIDHIIKNLNKWAKPEKKLLPPLYWPGTAKIVPEPYGVTLIMAPWNYPLQLVISPLAGAIAAGNCAMVKSSHLSVNTNKIIKQIIEENFEPEYINFIEAGPSRTAKILESPFDLIFYTGSTKVGRIVMQAAAKNLTPVVLELGGKSPCIVDRSADLEKSARRIVWGKFMNAGQTCIAPDYMLVHKDIHDELLDIMKRVIHEFYGDDPFTSADYGRIINQTHFRRVSSLISGEIVTGGQMSREERYIAPTIIDNVTWDSSLMENEIFGPVLPVMQYGDIEDVLSDLREKPSPLALYLFTTDSKIERKVLEETSSGGVCINHTVLHASPAELPFGGVGESGMGSYRGKATFDSFSHYRSIMKKSFRFDNDLLYPPYVRVDGLIKKLFGWLG